MYRGPSRDHWTNPQVAVSLNRRGAGTHDLATLIWKAAPRRAAPAALLRRTVVRSAVVRYHIAAQTISEPAELFLVRQSSCTGEPSAFDDQIFLANWLAREPIF